MIYNLPYIVTFIILALSLYIIIASSNLYKKLLGISIFQSSVILFFINMGKVKDASPPILKCYIPSECPEIYANPLPHVLMLTSIVVGIAVLAISMSLIIRIKEEFQTVDEDIIVKFLNSSSSDHFSINTAIHISLIKGK